MCTVAAGSGSRCFQPVGRTFFRLRAGGGGYLTKRAADGAAVGGSDHVADAVPHSQVVAADRHTASTVHADKERAVVAKRGMHAAINEHISSGEGSKVVPLTTTHEVPPLARRN